MISNNTKDLIFDLKNAAPGDELERRAQRLRTYMQRLLDAGFRADALNCAVAIVESNANQTAQDYIFLFDVALAQNKHDLIKAHKNQSLQKYAQNKDIHHHALVQTILQNFDDDRYPLAQETIRDLLNQNPRQEICVLLLETCSSYLPNDNPLVTEIGALAERLYPDNILCKIELAHHFLKGNDLTGTKLDTAIEWCDKAEHLFAIEIDKKSKDDEAPNLHMEEARQRIADLRNAITLHDNYRDGLHQDSNTHDYPSEHTAMVTPPRESLIKDWYLQNMRKKRQPPPYHSDPFPDFSLN